MTDGSNGASEGRPPETHSRERVLVVVVVAIAVIAVTAVLFVAAIRLESNPTPSGFPNGSAGGVLFYGQAQGVSSLYEHQFTVPVQSGTNTPVKIELAALVNVSCGGPPSYWTNQGFVCSMSLVHGSTGGPTENPLWTEYFSGPATSNVSMLSPGLYTLLVHVDLGSAPAAVIIVPFSVTAVVTTVA